MSPLVVRLGGELRVVGGTAPAESPPPTAPVGLSVSAAGPHALIMSWGPAIIPGGTVARYELSVDGGAWVTVTSPHIITGLSPETTYSVAVRAVGDDGQPGPAATGQGQTSADEPEPPPPASWQAALDSRDIEQVHAWYQAHTGHDGINPDDPTDLPLDESDLTWVAGGIRSTHDGQVLEGLHSNHIRISHSNVTVRRCRVTGGSTYGSFPSPTFGSTFTNLLMEYVTFEGGDPPVDKRAILHASDSSVTGFTATYRHCSMFGWSSGFTRSHANVEYCYTFDFFNSSVEGAHVSSFVARGPHVRFFRNFGTEGGSPIMSIYFDQRPTHDVEIRENILYGYGGRNQPSYLLFAKTGDYIDDTWGIVIADNYLGAGYQFGPVAGLGSIPWGIRGNELGSHHIDFFTS